MRAIVLILGILIIMPRFAFAYSLKLSEAELQQKVEAVMPLEKKHFFLTVVLSDPQIELLGETNQIGLFMNISAVAPGGFKGSGRGKVVGSIRYDRDTGAFFITDPVLAQLHIDRVTDKVNIEITKLAQLAIGSALSRYPVYQLKDDDFKQKMARSMLDSVEVKGDYLLINLKAF